MAPIGTPDDWFAWLEDPGGARRHEAKLILGGLLPTDPVPVAPLLARLTHANEEIVFWSIVALGRLEVRASAAATEVERLVVAHPAFRVREAAIDALAKIAPTAPGTWRSIQVAFQDTSALVRRQALQASIAVPSLTSDDLAVIESLQIDGDEAVRRWSEIALRNIALRKREPASEP